MSNDPQYAELINAPQPRTSGLAITSLVLGLLSFLTCCVTGVPAIIFGAIGLGRIGGSGGALRGKGIAIAGIILGSIGTLLVFALALVGYQFARKEGPSHAAAVEMMRIGVAFQEYAKAKGQLPAPASYDAAGRPLLSWRVHLLPMLGEMALYRKFHLDEPWDSPHNRALLNEMPVMYGVGLVQDNTTTRYLMPTGPGSLLPDKHGQPLQGIADGAANTIALVEVDDAMAVPWTAPQDYEYNSAQPRAGLGNLRTSGFWAAMADGSVHFLKNTIPPNTLKQLFDPADNSGMTVEKAIGETPGS